MKQIVKFGTFNLDEFIEWQMKEERHISNVSPLIEAINSNFGEDGELDMHVKTVQRVFVIYVEEVK